MNRRRFLSSLSALPVAAQTSTWRPVFLGMEGMVASGHYGTAMSGYKMLAQGGNAVDAAVAAAMSSTVFEPSRTGVGGDLFILLYLAKTKQVKFINGTGWAPRKATIDRFASRKELPKEGPQAPLVPGAVDALLLAAERYGKLGRDRLLAPSIETAGRGFIVSENLHGVLRNNDARLKRFPTTVNTWYRNGEPLRMGNVLQQPELARTFRTIAESGRDGFYRGPVAKAMTQFLKAQDGLLDLEDFAEFSAHEDTPLHIHYKGYDLYGCPPNSHGHVMLQALNILEGFDLKSMGHNSAAYLHHVAEALKLCFADREKYVGDPRFIKDIPLKEMLSKEYAAKRRALIKPDQAIAQPVPAGNPRAMSAGARPDYITRTGGIVIARGALAYPAWIDGYTTYYAAVDSERNMVSITSTIWSDFGNCQYIPEVGFFPNNRLALFYLDPADPNALAPRKRPRMTLNPVLVMKNGKPFMVFGTPGGDTMPQSQLQFFLNFAEFGMNVQQAVEQPYVISSAFRSAIWPHGSAGKLAVSERIPDDVRKGLTDRGHDLITHAAKGVGSVKAILIDPETNTLMGGAAPATDSYAIGW
ncbi:MAG: gamma-glutamyltransferase [Bryobacterales bacterium]|nr:gamma-glutamyltransferase [Bryobacterales bacterium]